MTPNDRTEPGVCRPLEKRYRCPSCWQRFYFKPNLDYHMQRKHGAGQQPAQPRRCCRKHEAEDLNGRIFGRLFIVCPTCQDKRCPHADDCANACSQQPAQPDSGEVRRWNIDCDGDDLLICFDYHDKGEKCEYERYVPASALTAAQQRIADLKRLWEIDLTALTQVIAERDAAQQRIAAMRDAFAMIRLFAQDGIENGHDRTQIGNQYAIRDLCDDFLKEPT